MTNPEEDGTAIGDALTLAVSRLDDADAKSKIILLLTDGSNTAGEESPFDGCESRENAGD